MATGAALAGALSTGIFGQARKGKGSSLQWRARNRPDLLSDEALQVASGMLPQMPLRPSAEPDPNAGRFGPDFAPARAGALGGIQRFRDQAQEALAPTAGAGVEGAFPVPPVREPQRPGFFGTRDPGSRLVGEVMRRREQQAARVATEKRNRWQLDQQTRMEGEDRQAAQREQETKQAQQFKTEQVRQEREVEQQKAKAKRIQDTADEAKKDKAKRWRWDIDAQRASDAGLGMTRVAAVRSGSLTLPEAMADWRRETAEARVAGSAVSAKDRQKDAKDKAAEDFAARLINMRLIAEDRYPAKGTEVQEAYAVEWARGKGAPPLTETEPTPQVAQSPRFRQAVAEARGLQDNAEALERKAATDPYLEDEEREQLTQRASDMRKRGEEIIQSLQGVFTSGQFPEAAPQEAQEPPAEEAPQAGAMGRAPGPLTLLAGPVPTAVHIIRQLLGRGGQPEKGAVRPGALAKPPTAPSQPPAPQIGMQQITDLLETGQTHTDPAERSKAQQLLAWIRGGQ